MPEWFSVQTRMCLVPSLHAVAFQRYREKSKRPSIIDVSTINGWNERATVIDEANYSSDGRS